MTVFLLWKMDEDDLYPVDSVVLGVYATEEAAERKRATMPEEYLVRYPIEERKVEE